MTSAPQPPSDRSEQLERFAHRALRELQAHRAPRSLEGRVLAEIARRAALPWWRRSFSHWPLVARMLFLMLSTAVAGLSLLPGPWVEAGWQSLPWRETFAEPVAWLDGLLAAGHALREFGEVAFRGIPALWLYGVLAFFGALYAAFLGLGTAAYRMIRAQH